MWIAINRCWQGKSCKIKQNQRQGPSHVCLCLQHFVRNVPALHDVLVLINIRYVPVNTVLPEERVLVSSISGFSGYRLLLLKTPPEYFESYRPPAYRSQPLLWRIMDVSPAVYTYDTVIELAQWKASLIISYAAAFTVSGCLLLAT